MAIILVSLSTVSCNSSWPYRFVKYHFMYFLSHLVVSKIICILQNTKINTVSFDETRPSEKKKKLVTDSIILCCKLSYLCTDSVVPTKFYEQKAWQRHLGTWALQLAGVFFSLSGTSSVLYNVLCIGSTNSENYLANSFEICECLIPSELFSF